jgi:hypothetical protein
MSIMNPSNGHLAVGTEEIGSELAGRYQTGEPFAHIVVDNFLPEQLIDASVAFLEGLEPMRESSDNEKFEFKKREIKPEECPDALREMFYSFNSLPFIRFVESVTRIKGLIPDPYFLGAGFHEVGNGGHLSVHADFDHHEQLDLERRINVIIYLNRDWVPEFGGQLELWDLAMKRCVRTIEPIANRCVIFNTTSTSYHGHPKKYDHPRGVSRKSIALYYYTATWDGSRRKHTTQWKKRGESGDFFDWETRTRELVQDIVPPVLLRTARNIKRRLVGTAE